MVKNRQKGITKAYRNDKKDVDTRNARELFSVNRGVSHLNNACRIDDVSRGSLSCYNTKFSQTTSSKCTVVAS